MATYKQIQDYVKGKYGLMIKTCWIAHIKEECGLERKNALNRINPTKRKYSCPDDKKCLIEEAFKHFNMME